MAALISPPSTSFSPNLSLLHRTTTPPPSSLSLHSPFSFSRLFTLSTPKRTAFRASTVAEQDKALTPEEGYKKELAKPCELYVCNLPRSCDISELLDLFKPYGSVHSVEEHEGYPSGSMVDFSCDHDSSPILAESAG
ncbi:uncharacterized protein A4U43_C05F4980 [Asparagus officinalis]|uniref:RRM domain-containing protein n=1 Tax=Asparagus officinalis TaxID=4686 RepID=A0A5P1EPF5_ASPOF|nr:uncharacterized protein A4U43_C05F4980 [Asparagus officinalis]